MSDLSLTPEPPLGGFQASFADTTLAEAANLAVVSIAVPAGGDAAFASALTAAYGTSRPEPGGSTHSSDGKTRFIWMARDQIFALFEDGGDDAAAGVIGKLKNTAYGTLQSDSWAALRLTGSKARVALERICPLDLHPMAFPQGRVARTVMEHLGTIILREGEDSFLLLSASSSAGSFLHAVKTSIENVS